jgi:hypothetical protein
MVQLTFYFLGSALGGKMIVTELVKKLRNFMKPEGSLPCSQETATELFPEADESRRPSTECSDLT